MTYEYDKAGNLTCRKEYDYTSSTDLDNRTPNKTVTYTYQNGRMTSYDGESCVYDENGNPTTYRGKALTWTRGRLLETYPSLTSPNVTWTFTYNADGIRVGKSAPDTTTTYGVDGERIVYEKTNGQIKRYFYDESGIAGFEYSGQKYVFRKNLQGDVVGIYSSSGTLIGEYVYDAWGNLLEEPTNSVLLANPFRYRGYYYDSSIGLYYLNSRYYDPETGRFLNEDLVSYLEPETIGGINLYAYCLNDPVNYIDPTGHKAEWWQWLISGIEVVVGSALVATGVASGVGIGLIGLGVGSMISGAVNESTGGSFTAGWTGGQVGGIFSFIPYIGATVGAFTSSVVTDWIDKGWDNVDWPKAQWSALFGFMLGAPYIEGMTNVFVNFIQAKNSVLISLINSIINSFWRRKGFDRNKKRDLSYFSTYLC